VWRRAAIQVDSSSGDSEVDYGDPDDEQPRAQAAQGQAYPPPQAAQGQAHPRPQAAQGQAYLRAPAAQGQAHPRAPAAQDEMEDTLVPRRKSNTELARECYTVFLGNSETTQKLFDKFDRCMDKYLDS
jgi:hypothetical protein